MTLPPPRLAVLEKGRFRSRIRTYLTALAIVAIYSWRFFGLQRKLAAEGGFLDPRDRRELRLRRRFAAGAAAGFIASKDALSRSFWSPTNFIYADLCAYWSNCLIAADAATDLKALSRDDIAVLFARAFAAMIRPVATGLPGDLKDRLERRHAEVLGQGIRAVGDDRDGPDDRFERYTLRMAQEIGRCIAHLTAANGMTMFAEALDQFYSRTLDLMAGQLDAYEQSIVDADRDWGWYRIAMHNKFMNVLLAPLGLFADPGAGLHPEPSMRRAFHLLNRIFFHRQVLDDLMDFDEDLDGGIANSLIYMLMSQGRIAAAFAARGTGVAGEAIVREELRRSCMLTAHGSDEGRDCGEPPEAIADIDACVTQVLANRPADRQTELVGLAAECIERRALLLEAWQRRDREAVRAIVVRSGVAGRILSTIAGGAHLRDAEEGLRGILRDGKIYGFVYIYYVRTLRTYRRCVQKWRPHVSGPA